MKLKGRVVVTLPSRMDGPQRFALTIVDEASHVEFLELWIDPAELMLALTAHISSGANCDIRLRGLDLIGKTREVKEVLVRAPKRVFDDEAKDAVVIRAAISEHEVDGWKGQDGDLRNGNRQSGAGTYRVAFTRYVEPKA